MRIDGRRKAHAFGRRHALIIGAVFAAAATDLLLKGMAKVGIGDGSTPFLPFLSLHLQENIGISFSLFPAEANGALLMLIVVQFAGTLFVIWLLVRATTTPERLGFSLIVGGAIGNLVDRMADGAVTDFLHLHPFDISLFTFNFADVLISLGVCLVLFDAVFGRSPTSDGDA
ncbi:lipoprotein signal peptidase [Methylopila jiangsuensis]|uniref:Lipoprotein signal peptidase n=1 Tax=Methylopila jiangsuensis TaxID=586230 RepID=A0A9W6JFM0_9HYPH|nr:signal peptidase II [Methylopila jiangsuensis]MDR6287379.1 signal peptidase II [Methylopila jiangsuensis]GLK74960.1 lipoprotein signal peptidase [Methylopila jiangsuensis]